MEDESLRKAPRSAGQCTSRSVPDPLVVLVRKSIASYAMIRSGDRVLAGVSGGADSVCLLLVLREMGFPIGVAHLNHGLRGSEADQDQQFVNELACRLGVPCFTRCTDISVAPGNREDAGRRARRQFFDETAAREGYNKIALAHSRDDRAETLLLNLFRGAGLEGLAGMRPVSGNTIRPLIDADRESITDYLTQHGQVWRTDASNTDLKLRRNWTRHTLIPLLRSEVNPRLVEALSRTAEILQAEDAWMARTAEAWLDDNASPTGRELVVRLESLPPDDPAFVRRAVRAVLRRFASSLDGVGYDHIEAVRSLLRGHKSGRRVEIPGGLIAERSFGTLVFRRSAGQEAGYEYSWPIPGCVSVPEAGKVFRAYLVDRTRLESRTDQVLVDGEILGPCVRIRNWKGGDVYSPVGLPAGKVKKLFQKARIPRYRRGRWPVVVNDSPTHSSIIWVASFPVSCEFAPDGRSRRIVALEVSPL